MLEQFYDARFLLLPLAFLCASVTVNAAAMLSLAYLCGFLWDAQHVLLPPPADAPDAVYAIEALPFGYSIILYGLMGFIMQLVQPLFRQGKWHISALITGVATFIYLMSEYILINFIRGDFQFSGTTQLKIIVSSALTMFVAPLFYWVLFRLADLCHYTISYQGLKKTNPYLID